MKGDKIIKLLLAFSLSIFLFGTGYKLGQYRVNRQQSPPQSLNLTNTSPVLDSKSKKNIDFSLFWETWNTVEQKFIDRSKLDPKKMFYAAIKGMVASTDDPYTFFLSPDENKQSKDDLGGKFEGIGAQLGLKDNRIVIIAPLKKSPAEKAGAKAGDFINKVDKVATKGWTLPQAVAKIRGPKGTKVILTLERTEKEHDVTMTREQIQLDSVELSYESMIDCRTNCPQLAYLKLNQFIDNTNDEWDEATDEIKSKWSKKEIKGMVLDLRDNPGGYLDSAVYLASEFLPQGKIVVKQESTTTESKDYYVIRAGKLPNIPLVVLINKGSASASEILAGALRDYKRAKLVGEKSFGKGSVQEAMDLSDGAGLHITVAKWILPKGDWINGKGIEPDIKVENQQLDGNTPSKDQDKQLVAAEKELLK